MILHFFTEHPAEVGESFATHFGVAGRFGMTMIGAGCACVLHAFLPNFFKTTGSDAVERLHQQMVSKRRRKMHEIQDARVLNWVI